MSRTHGDEGSHLYLKLTAPVTDDLEEARAYLATIETPWEPYDELEKVIKTKARTSSIARLSVPWKLMREFIKVVEQAKNSCSPGRTSSHMTVMRVIERTAAKRSVIDRLSDLVA